MPHPCVNDPTLEGCAELALQHAAAKVAGGTPAEAIPTLAEALGATCPAVVTEYLNTVLLKIGAWIEATETLAIEHMPLLVKEVIHFQILRESIWVGLGLLLIFWGVYAYRWSYQGAAERLERIKANTEALRDIGKERNSAAGQREDYGLDETEDQVFSFLHYGIPISGGIAAAGGILLIFCNLMGLLKPIIAPRLYLIEYFRQLAE